MYQEGIVDERRQARIDLSAALRLAARFDLHEGIDNHFSIMLGDGSFLVNRWGVHWSLIRASDILQVDGSGTVIDGRGEVERTALVIHAAVHRTCPHARVVLHTHMPFATAIACSRQEIEPISQNALRFVGRIFYDDAYSGLANDEAEGVRIAKVVQNQPIVFMRHHGVLVTAQTVGLAFDDLYFLERTARVQLLAKSSGADVMRIPQDIVKIGADQLKLIDRDRETHFAALKQILDVQEPEYAK